MKEKFIYIDVQKNPHPRRTRPKLRRAIARKKKKTPRSLRRSWVIERLSVLRGLHVCEYWDGKEFRRQRNKAKHFHSPGAAFAQSRTMQSKMPSSAIWMKVVPA